MADNLSPYFEGAFLTAGLTDWSQTRQIARNSNDYYEKNILLGEHPSQTAVDTYMPAIGLAHYELYKALPEKIRLPYALASALAEFNTIKKNKENGLDYNYPSMILGAILTSYLFNDKNTDKYYVSPSMIDKSPAVMLNMKF